MKNHSSYINNEDTNINDLKLKNDEFLNNVNSKELINQFKKKLMERNMNDKSSFCSKNERSSFDDDNNQKEKIKSSIKGSNNNSDVNTELNKSYVLNYGNMNSHSKDFVNSIKDQEKEFLKTNKKNIIKLNMTSYSNNNDCKLKENNNSHDKINNSNNEINENTLKLSKLSIKGLINDHINDFDNTSNIFSNTVNINDNLINKINGTNEEDQFNENNITNYLDNLKLSTNRDNNESILLNKSNNIIQNNSLNNRDISENYEVVSNSSNKLNKLDKLDNSIFIEEQSSSNNNNLNAADLLTMKNVNNNKHISFLIESNERDTDNNFDKNKSININNKFTIKKENNNNNLDCENLNFNIEDIDLLTRIQLDIQNEHQLANEYLESLDEKRMHRINHFKELKEMHEYVDFKLKNRKNNSENFELNILKNLKEEEENEEEVEEDKDQDLENYLFKDKVKFLNTLREKRKSTFDNFLKDQVNKNVLKQGDIVSAYTPGNLNSNISSTIPKDLNLNILRKKIRLERNRKDYIKSMIKEEGLEDKKNNNKVNLKSPLKKKKQTVGFAKNNHFDKTPLFENIVNLNDSDIFNQKIFGLDDKATTKYLKKHKDQDEQLKSRLVRKRPNKLNAEKSEKKLDFENISFPDFYKVEEIEVINKQYNINESKIIYKNTNNLYNLENSNNLSKRENDDRTTLDSGNIFLKGDNSINNPSHLIENFVLFNFDEDQNDDIEIRYLNEYDFFRSLEYIIPLLNYIKNNDISLLEKDDFVLENFLYKHRDFVYKGKLIQSDTKCYVKRFSLVNSKDLYVLMNELTILNELKNSQLFYLSGIHLPFLYDIENIDDTKSVSSANSSESQKKSIKGNKNEKSEKNKGTIFKFSDKNIIKYQNELSNAENSKANLLENEKSKNSFTLRKTNTNNSQYFVNLIKQKINNINLSQKVTNDNEKNNVEPREETISSESNTTSKADSDHENKFNEDQNNENNLKETTKTENLNFNNLKDQIKTEKRKEKSNKKSDKAENVNLRVIEKQKLCAFLVYENEYYPLEQFLKKRNKKEDLKLIVLKNLCKMMLAFHSKGICIIDIKPEFIYLDKSLNIKYFDFYNSIKIDEIGKNKKIIYSPTFASPEYTLCWPKIGFSQDIFSLGCLFILLFIDYKKYDETSLKIYIKRIFNNTTYFVYSKEDNDNQLKIFEELEYTDSNNNDNDGNNSNIEYDKESKLSRISKLTSSNDKNIYETFKKIRDKIIETKIPIIPKTINSNIAKIIKSCFEINPLLRPDIITIIEYFNSNIFTQITSIDENIIEIQAATKMSFYGYLDKVKTNYMKDKNTFINSFCSIHKLKSEYYCESCQIFCCKICQENSHSIHITINVDQYYQMIEMIFYNKIKDLDNKFLNTDFLKILSLENDLNQNYEDQKVYLETKYLEIHSILQNLKARELNSLESSKKQFLQNKFSKLFKNADVIESQYKDFYQVKTKFLAYYKRFINTLNDDQLKITYLNYSPFVKKFEKFYKFSEQFRLKAEHLIKLSKTLQIMGKYVYTNETYTKHVIKSLKEVKKRIIKDNHVFFDFAPKNNLFLPKEIVVLIPNTNLVYSYIKNSFKILSVNFDVYNIDIKHFLKGSSVLHFKNTVYIIGGDYNNEGIRNGFTFTIEEKILSEIPELNTSRRYLTLTIINSFLLCAIGGWSSNDVEVLDIKHEDQWINFPKMNQSRSDCSAFVFNNKWLYVFGGWDYETKMVCGGIERYECFDQESKLKLYGSWELISIKSNFQEEFLKYNMAILLSKKSENVEEIIILGGCDSTGEYSDKNIFLEFNFQSEQLIFNKIESNPNLAFTFWSEKNFNIFENEDGTKLAVNFNSNNDLIVYKYIEKEFSIHINDVQLKN